MSQLISRNPRKNYDFQYIMGFNRLVAKITASWPDSEKDPLAHRLLKRLINAICMTALTAHVISLSLYLVYADVDVESRLTNLGLINFALMCQIKYILVLFKSSEILKCINQIASDWQEPKRSDKMVMVKYAKTGRLFSISCTCSIFLSCLFYNFPILVVKPRLENNVTVHVVAYPAEFLVFDARVSPYYVYVQLFQLVISVVLASLLCNVMCIITSCSMHVCGQLYIVMQGINRMYEERLVRVSRSVGAIVRRHSQILRFISLLEKTFSPIFLIEMLECIIGICFCEYMMIFERNGIVASIFDFISLIAISFTILIFCYFGEKIIEKCEDIGAAVYLNRWYMVPKTNIRSFTLMIYVCQRPPKLTAGKISVLCIDTFSEVQKKSLAFLNVFRAMMVS